jgi:hypothetical protein
MVEHWPERRGFIKSSIKEIRLTGHDAVITYSMPIIPEKTNLEREAVPPIIHYGGR